MKVSDLDVERSVLAAILHYGYPALKYCSQLEPECFFHPDHAAVFKALRERLCFERDDVERVDVIGAYLASQGHKVRWLELCCYLTDGIPCTHEISWWAEQVYHHWQIRSAILIGSEIRSQLRRGELLVDVIDRSVERLMACREEFDAKR